MRFWVPSTTYFESRYKANGAILKGDDVALLPAASAVVQAATLSADEAGFM